MQLSHTVVTGHHRITYKLYPITEVVAMIGAGQRVSRPRGAGIVSAIGSASTPANVAVRRRLIMV
jgi:hypothetical protein